MTAAISVNETTSTARTAARRTGSGMRGRPTGSSTHNPPPGPRRRHVAIQCVLDGVVHLDRSPRHTGGAVPDPHARLHSSCPVSAMNAPRPEAALPIRHTSERLRGFPARRVSVGGTGGSRTRIGPVARQGRKRNFPVWVSGSSRLTPFVDGMTPPPGLSWGRPCAFAGRPSAGRSWRCLLVPLSPDGDLGVRHLPHRVATPCQLFHAERRSRNVGDPLRRTPCRVQKERSPDAALPRRPRRLGRPTPLRSSEPSLTRASPSSATNARRDDTRSRRSAGHRAASAARSGLLRRVSFAAEQLADAPVDPSEAYDQYNWLSTVLDFQVILPGLQDVAGWTSRPGPSSSRPGPRSALPRGGVTRFGAHRRPTRPAVTSGTYPSWSLPARSTTPTACRRCPGGTARRSTATGAGLPPFRCAPPRTRRCARRSPSLPEAPRSPVRCPAGARIPAGPARPSRHDRNGRSQGVTQPGETRRVHDDGKGRRRCAARPRSPC